MYYDYTDDQNSCIKKIAQSTQILMKATIKCVPPTLHMCQNVPATACDEASFIKSKIYFSANNNTNNQKQYSLKHCVRSAEKTNTNFIGTTFQIFQGASYQYWKQKKYVYEKHKHKNILTERVETERGIVGNKDRQRHHNTRNCFRNYKNYKKNGVKKKIEVNKKRLIVKNQRQIIYNSKKNITALTHRHTLPILSSHSFLLLKKLSLENCRTTTTISELTLKTYNIINKTKKSKTAVLITSTNTNMLINQPPTSLFRTVKTKKPYLEVENNTITSNAALKLNLNKKIGLFDNGSELIRKQLVMPILLQKISREKNNFKLPKTKEMSEAIQWPLGTMTGELNWKTTIVVERLTNTSVTASENVSHTTKTQPCFSDINTHCEVENLKCLGDDVRIARVNGCSERNINTKCFENSSTKIKPWRTRKHRSNSLLLRQQLFYNIVQRQKLWQQISIRLLMILTMLKQQRHQVVKTLTTPSSPKKFLMFSFMILMLTTTVNCWPGRQDVPSNCTFPLRWEGSWFLSGYQQSIHIKGSQISYRGRCAASDGNKYLIVDEKGCHRCLVIYEKHENVLQYKESECEGDSMYMHQTNPSAMAMRSVLKQSGGDHRGGAHPNTNGHSRLSSSDQYIMRSNDDMNDYFCKGRETLQNLCDQIPGDALLYSLFRENAEPVKCPLKGPFIFTYNRGHGECKSPVSNIESCTEDSRLLLSFQACPDVQGTESTVEELTCLAAWKDGNSRYLVGLVSHHHAISNEERYRCFVYEKISTLMGGPSMISSKDAEYKLAQSGDATCNGLDSAEVGSRIMTLRKPPVAERCDFPAWFKGPRHWYALMGNAVYNYHTNDGSVHIIKSNGYMETRALCEQINKQTSTEMMAVVHYTTGCQSGFMCMMFYRRDTHVIEIQTGKQASRLEDACAPDHFDVHKMPYITLLASNPDPQICPMEGLYNLRGAIGPPYLTTRHKRNHNHKVHSVHGHHHFNDGYGIVSNVDVGSKISGTFGEMYGHKRRDSLSFRNSDRIEKLSWHANTRGLPIRIRRNAATDLRTQTVSALILKTNEGTRQTNNEKANGENQQLSKRVSLVKAKELSPVTLMPAVEVGTVKIVTTIDSTDLATVKQRSRRDVPGCITNVKAQRQLWVGCTEPNVIDVRPLCNDDGDEEYYCHGSWTENSTIYIIARHKRTKHGVCISYKPTEKTTAKLVIGDACHRGTDKPPEHHLVANLSVFGKCGETNAAFSIKFCIWNFWITLAVSFFATLNSRAWSSAKNR